MLTDTEIDRICTDWENDPKATDTILKIAGSLRELQRYRHAMPKKTDIDAFTENTDYAQGWNACVDAVEKAMKGEG